MLRSEFSIWQDLERRLERYHDPHTNETVYLSKGSDVKRKSEEDSTAFNDGDASIQCQCGVEEYVIGLDSPRSELFSNLGRGCAFPVDPNELTELAIHYTNECRVRALSELHEVQSWLEKMQELSPESPYSEPSPIAPSPTQLQSQLFPPSVTPAALPTAENPTTEKTVPQSKSETSPLGWSHFIRQFMLFGALPIAVVILLRKYPCFNCPRRIRDKTAYAYIHRSGYLDHLFSATSSFQDEGIEEWWDDIIRMFPAFHFISLALIAALQFLQTLFDYGLTELTGGAIVQTNATRNERTNGSDSTIS